MRVIKDDGRYLIFYGFERPLPRVFADQAEEVDENPQGARRIEPSGSGGNGGDV